MKFKKEIIVGFTVLLAIGLLAWGANYLKGTNLFAVGKSYYAVYPKVDGLAEAGPVMYNGYKVGTINEIYFHPSYNGTIVVRFSVNEKGLKLKKDAIATIKSADILGTKAIDLHPGISQIILKPGDTLLASIDKTLTEEVNAQILPLKVKVESLIGSLDTAITKITSVFNEGGDLDESFASIKRSMQTFEKTAKRIDTLFKNESGNIAGIIQHVRGISANLDKNGDKLTNVIKNFSSLSDSLAAADIAGTINNTKKAMEQLTGIMEKINKGEGSMGMLMHNDTLYRNLAAASRDLDLLMEDMRLHPGRYVRFSVFGKKDKSYKGDAKIKYDPQQGKTN
ncbi:MAG: MCE family protein [Flavobacteriales bacterium]|nr:MCE family protein [Flavobacteriales bacterium]